MTGQLPLHACFISNYAPLFIATSSQMPQTQHMKKGDVKCAQQRTNFLTLLIIINGRRLDKRFLSSDLWGFIANRAEEVALN